MSEGPASIPPCDVQYKVVLVGDSGVGKTSLILKFVDNVFNEESVSTFGVDYKTKVITVNKKKVALVIWDTAGQERFRTISGTFYKGANGIVIVYDVTDEESFRSVQPWVTEIDRYVEDAQLLLVGNKIDASERRVVSKAAAEEIASDKIHVKYVETSAKSGENVEAMFETLVQDIIEGGNTQDTSGAAAAGSDIIKVSAVTQKPSPRKRGCCAKKTN